MRDWNHTDPPRPFYTASDGSVFRVCAVSGAATIHKCKNHGEMMELAHALNQAMNDVLLKPDQSPA